MDVRVGGRKREKGGVNSGATTAESMGVSGWTKVAGTLLNSCQDAAVRAIACQGKEVVERVKKAICGVARVGDGLGGRWEVREILRQGFLLV